ncbi:ABC transporter permease [Paenibacillus thermoaerophilus]|uniref:Transport permease protein n=1 Tax=Paenibacillus thermoaerophilus TaxID=1215385 RepID=A0ABW2V0Y6_9BACL|nr:ABC transporter permease [Paenibacillus thermoaerophilus]TMV17492.1 ABC transporter permease [Paenibacillus thermoaerophilus]
MKFFNRIYNSRYILLSLVRQDLKNKYRNSVLGIGWSLLSPLGLVLIIGTVFSQVLGQPLDEFLPFLFSGLIPWIFIVSCADGGTGAFISAEGYIKQTQTPLEVFPVRVTLGAFVNLLFSLSALLIMYLFLWIDRFSVVMLFIPISLFIWLLFGVALSIMSSIINTYFRDFAPLQSLLLQGFFYATPIMFPADILKKGNAEWVYIWNPIYYLIEIIRKPLLGTQIPPLETWLIAIGFVVFLFSVSIAVLSRIGRQIMFRL